MKILIIEDEKQLMEVMVQSLEKDHFTVECATDFHSAMLKINDYDYDCLLLDIMLPGGSGLSILKELKKIRKKTSVIIISAKDSIEDKVNGLNLGADDYLAKPFHLSELNARIKSVIRRNHHEGDMNIVLQNLSLTPETRTVAIDGKVLSLNRKEYDLLYYFSINPNRLIHKTSLAETIWGDYTDQSDSLDFIYSQVKNLRKKLKDAGALPELKAVYGFGYKLISE